MEITFRGMGLSENQETEFARLLALSEHNPPTLEDMWFLMDYVWDEMGCDNRKFNREKINEFYRHPVWLLNGFFLEQHELSMQHRNAIGDWITQNLQTTVLDFGGGFGTLAKIIADKTTAINIDIYEPYPSGYATNRLDNYRNIRFINELTGKYDCLVSTDVLEHVPDPLSLFWEMIDHVNRGGYLIIANHFYPVIKCHLPSTFHLRYSFHHIARLMGLKRLGPCEGSHATLFQKIHDYALSENRVKMLELLSKAMYPMFKAMYFTRRTFMRLTS